MGNLEIRQNVGNFHNNIYYQNTVDIDNKKQREHPRIKINENINENISFELRFSVNGMTESNIDQEVLKLSSKKGDTFRNSPAKLPRESSDACNSVLKNIFIKHRRDVFRTQSNIYNCNFLRK